MRTASNKRESGFTLVELLIVVAIIAILAAIAIPQFSAYRKRGYASTINADARNAYTITQAQLAENPQSSITCSNSPASSIALAGYKASLGVACSGDMTVTGGTYYVYPSSSAWGVSTATIDYLGNLTKSTAN